MQDPDSPQLDMALRIVAQRVVLEQFMATIFMALGQNKAQVEQFGAHVRSVLGVGETDDAAAAARAEQGLPIVVSHVDAILAEVVRNMRD